MNRSSIERRYGYGAARIRLGHPIETPRLAASTHHKVRGEMRFAFLPGLLCVLVSALLFSTTALQRGERSPTLDFVAIDPLRIELALASEPIARPTEDHEDAKRAQPSSTPVVTTTGPSAPTPAPPTSSPGQAPAPPPQFARLKLPAETTLPGDLAALPVRAPDPRPSTASSRPLDAEWTARVLSQTATRNRRPLELGRSSAPPTARAAARPSDNANGTHIPGQIAGVGPGSSRFMTPTQLPEHGPAGFTANATGDTPHVSAQRVQPEFAQSIRESLATVRAGRGTGDWREVPLAALPDCSPAGRQDRLKQEILRSTPPSGVCEHAEGRFRFVPSRNLGSFLMWTEEGGASTSSFAAAQDACVALEAALRCLTQAGAR